MRGRDRVRYRRREAKNNSLNRTEESRGREKIEKRQNGEKMEKGSNRM